MGQIVIDIPTNTRRRYVLADKGRADKFLDVLEASAIRVKADSDKLTPKQLEEIRDHDAAKRKMGGTRQSGVSLSVDDLCKEFGVYQDPSTPEELEYIKDVADIKKALAEYRRTGKTHRWKDVEAEIGL